MLEWPEYLKIFIALLVIVDPFAVLPLFVILTANSTKAERERTAHTASVAVGVVLSLATLFGASLLALFGISIASFKVGGAILILLMSVAMMEVKPVRDKQTPEEAVEAEEKESIAVVPLAIPLLAGPGAISTTIIYAAAAPGAGHRAVIMGACLLVAGLTWIALRLGTPLVKLLGRTGINIAIRLMGLLLAAVAVEIFASGIVTLLPGLGAR
jgi:multiple antibiotic resistance protein